jgi:hypothetical protein
MIESGGIAVISANTDGIVINCPVNLQGELEKIILKWENATQFITEETRYRAFIESNTRQLGENVSHYTSRFDPGKPEIKTL